MTGPTTGQSCCVVGAGPAGLMLGFLLARAGVRVTVIEKHADFLRDFRGDTIHPSTLEVMHELGFLDEFLKLPHQQAVKLHAEISGQQATIADFSRLPTRCKFIAFMPQWDFLSFLADKARAFPNFDLRMGMKVSGLDRSAGRVTGVRIINANGDEETISADLVIGADGRNSSVRREAGLEVEDLGASVDVLWMQVSRREDDPAKGMSHGGPNQGLILIDRGQFWQCGYVIRKGGFAETQAAGLPALRAKLAAVAPLPADRFEEIASWDQVHLLNVRMDRLKTWWLPGLLCIGDAAHAMSPVGGVGVNLAIQDAIAAANILAVPLRTGALTDADLRAVQKRRDFPTKATQKVQLMMRSRRKPGDESKSAGPPAFLRAIGRSRLLPHLTGRLIGLGFRPEHIKT
ncbi:2-polyprenyl-6-methoxyphenol hydroxylase [Hyphomicrobium sulfonivorans]|uniref:2-polyprenyl-6-methoxyphenol hydroxylase n=1 Tax=Hyphomicrobium sulfonivorans TaxID=121290 RepID=A0A109BAS2_HYPSL|nr:FAD-dependent oxidoreductase [Hyphomicrobium sulfonivorans]KWT65165.1 2-polyprenyl-6-methoxyphenol hydroxylase [Hyphomicrobium sulfonivorans]